MAINKIIACVCCILFFNLVVLQAQEVVNDRDYNFKNWRVLFQMNGPNNWNAALNFVKPVNEKWALRLGISPIARLNRSIRDNNEPEEYSSFEIKNLNRRLGIDLSIGAEFHLLKKGKLDPYVFFGTGIGGFIESNRSTSSFVLIQPRSDGLVEFNSEEKSIGTPRLSVDPFAGFGVNYFFHERFAFGIEYSLSPNMILLNGNNRTTRVETLTYDNGLVEVENFEIDNITNSFFIDLAQQIGFHMIYVLKKKAD